MSQAREWVERSGHDPELWALLEQDPRLGVRRLGVRSRQAWQRQEAEQARLNRLVELEGRWWSRGVEWVAGVDEVGRGCLAGPVVAAAVILRPGTWFPGLDDSKKLPPEKRERLAAEILGAAQAVGIGQVEAGEIDQLDILQASLKAMRLALAQLPIPPQQVLVDGNQRPGSPYPETTVIEGDSRSLSIAAASVVAKVHRDRLMVAYELQFPGYGFAGHKGYGSPQHLEALAALGPCVLHRYSFGPVARTRRASASFAVFREGLESCREGAELERFAHYIREGAGELLPGELEELRGLYRRRRQVLGGAGRRGEAEAAAYLSQRGYEILACGYRGAGGELDLVARQGECLVFVEVKSGAAGGLGHPEERVDAAKRDHLVRVARHYCQHHQVEGRECRFDVLAVVFGQGEPQITHLIDAFQA
ncbi:MAG: ribonuclease HII [Candidatus Latescibacteria bacterium]|nr:ribonuclease HII [Candidatus Latescibacterota bacterium]